MGQFSNYSLEPLGCSGAGEGGRRSVTQLLVLDMWQMVFSKTSSSSIASPTCSSSPSSPLEPRQEGTFWARS